MEFIIPIVLVVLALALLFSVVKIVPQGREFTVERFGRYTRTLKPGISFLTPFMEAVGRRVNVMEQVLDVPRQEVITRDNVSVQVDAIVFIQVMDAAAAAYRVDNLNFAITQLAQTNLRTVVGSMDLDEVLSQREQINTRLLQAIDHATGPWGVKATRIEIKDLIPPPDITQAMARQMKAERERRAVIIEADGEKQSAMTRAEGAKASAILQAEGRKEAAFRDAEARERQAEAEGRATTVVSEAISNGDVNAINYFVAQRYVDAFAQLASSPNQKTVIVPADLGALAGSIAWIAIAFEFNQKLIDKATGSKIVTRTDAARLYNLLENLCISRGVPVPTLRVMESEAPNAFATGLSPEQYSITVTTGLLALLNDAELEAVLAHELTHIRNDDVRTMVIAMIVTGILSFAGEMILRGDNPIRFSSRGSSDKDKGGGAFLAMIIALVLIGLVWFLSQFVKFALSRSREYLADAGAVELTKNPDALISALQKIEGKGEIETVPSGIMELCLDNPRSGLQDMFATHPPIAARVDALQRYAGGTMTIPDASTTEADRLPEPAEEPSVQPTPAPTSLGPWARDSEGGR